jgi:hypothetical protein
MIDKCLRDQIPSFVAERVGLCKAIALSHKSRLREFIYVRRRRCCKFLDLDRGQAKATFQAQSRQQCPDIVRLKERPDMLNPSSLVLSHWQMSKLSMPPRGIGVVRWNTLDHRICA